MTLQTELFKAETTWFHVFKSMIDSGDVATMGPHAVTVYLVIKAYTNFSTGRSFPAIETICEKSGISDKQVRRELKTLETHGYITKERKGRNNVYTLREKVDIHDDQGQQYAVATWDYLPTTVKNTVANLKNLVMSGDLAKRAEEGGVNVIHIGNLQVNVNHAHDNATINNVTNITKLTNEEKLQMLKALKEDLDLD